MSRMAVKVENISKVYKLYDSPSDRLKETFNLFRKKYHNDFYALNNISFEIEKGETIGIIGQNGAGKSTLLKILTGVLTPSSGSYSVNGKVSSLLELGAGFNPELTGLENVYFNGAIFGFSKQEMDEKLDKILAFADIGKFINQQVKTYSSGMFVRLAFAVAVQVDPDILIVDEALSVGDMRFQQKCFRRMRKFKDSGKIVLFVTHDQGAVINFCNYVFWLKDGEIFQQGKPKEVVKKYISFMAYGLETNDEPEKKDAKEQPTGSADKQIAQTEKMIAWENVSECSSFGEGGAQITGVAMYHEGSTEKVSILKGGEPVVFFLRLKINEYIENAGVGISVVDQLGTNIFAIPSFVYDFKIPALKKGEELLCKIKFIFPEIKNGKYCISTAIAEGNQINHIQHHWLHDVYFVEISNNDLKYSLGHAVVIKESEFDISFLS